MVQSLMYGIDLLEHHVGGQLLRVAARGRDGLGPMGPGMGERVADNGAHGTNRVGAEGVPRGGATEGQRRPGGLLPNRTEVLDESESVVAPGKGQSWIQTPKSAAPASSAGMMSENTTCSTAPSPAWKSSWSRVAVVWPPGHSTPALRERPDCGTESGGWLPGRAASSRRPPPKPRADPTGGTPRV